MLHVLKWDDQPSMRSRSWTLTIREQRQHAERQLRKNPGLKSQVDEALEAAYEARLETANETGLPLSIFPVRRPFEHAEIMQRSIIWPGDED
jgi:hypothetical protein